MGIFVFEDSSSWESPDVSVWGYCAESDEDLTIFFDDYIHAGNRHPAEYVVPLFLGESARSLHCCSLCELELGVVKNCSQRVA